MRIHTILLLLSLPSFIISQLACPPQCTCLNKVIRCLRKKLTTVPRVEDARTLDLRFNNISRLRPGEINHLKDLRSLLLNNNELLELRRGSFAGLQNLVNLYLYHNRIQYIEPHVFEGLSHLEQLYLHENQLHQISPDTFNNLPRLEKLYLHKNFLKSIPQDSFQDVPNLQTIRLDSNALICDCSMLWLLEMISHHTTMKLVATCHGPPKVIGATFSNLSGKDLNCREPEITEGPQDTIVHFGEDVSFSCKVVGEPKPEIHWFRDSNELLSNSRYEIINETTLMMHNIEDNDLGYIECMAKNVMGEAHSKPARVMMTSANEDKDKLYFTVLPSNKMVKIGDKNVNLDCQAAGDPEPHISWLFNGERILRSDNNLFQNNGTLTLAEMREFDVGNYTCIAENSYNKISETAIVDIIDMPSFSFIPENVTAFEGEDVEFNCKASGNPKPRINWFKNNEWLPEESDNYVMESDNEKLVLFKVSANDNGVYECRIENSEGVATESALLTVKEYKKRKPMIIVAPEDTEVYEQTTIQLFCETDGETVTSMQWRKDGSRIVNRERFSIMAIGALLINNVSLADTGAYECIVYNKYGRDAASAFLRVKSRILPGDQYVNVALTEAIRDVDRAIANTVEYLFNNNSRHIQFHDLFRISRYPDAPARDLARAAEIYELTLMKVRNLTKSGISTDSAEPFNYNNILSPKHLDIIARLSGCTAHREEKNCSDMCYHSKYRSIDGSCNNLANPMWGSSLSGFKRILTPVYEDGFSQPVGWNKNIKYNGFALPSARLVSTVLISTVDITADVEITHMTMQWGQWLDHDLDHALPSVSSQTWEGVDCKKTCAYAAPCFPIDVPPNDHRIKNRRCIDFIRTSSVCGSGSTSVFFGKLQPREQINQLTSYLDASQVYGFERLVAEDLRDLTNEKGLLRVGAKFPNRKALLPTLGLNGMDCRRNLEESNINCFVAGDIRANEQIGLAAMHTIWMREHNRLAVELKAVNPFWDGNKTYNEARKIVGAEMQFITYEHWLPIILGRKEFLKLGKYQGYNENIDASITNVFATAALRFGHSLINPVLHRYNEDFETIPQGHLLLRDAFFAPWRLVDEGGVDPLLRGMFMTPAKLKTPTQNLNSELTEKLFYTAHAVALDLAAINIQRAREHGIPSYTKWRQYCKMSEINTFEDLAPEISNETVRQKLKDLYGSPHNIDVWVGGILEDQVEGGKVGPLFSCLLLEQFRRLRDGDRFWYENPSTFEPKQLQQIRRTSLARVLCDNGDNLDTINDNVFLLPDLQEGLVECESIPGIDLEYWADCETCDNKCDSRNKHRGDSRTEHYRNNI